MLGRHALKRELGAADIKQRKRPLRPPGLDRKAQGIGVKPKGRGKVTGVEPDGMQAEPDRWMIMAVGVMMIVIVMVIVGLIVRHDWAMTGGDEAQQALRPLNHYGKRP